MEFFRAGSTYGLLCSFGHRLKEWAPLARRLEHAIHILQKVGCTSRGVAGQLGRAPLICLGTLSDPPLQVKSVRALTALCSTLCRGRSRLHTDMPPNGSNTNWRMGRSTVPRHIGTSKEVVAQEVPRTPPSVSTRCPVPPRARRSSAPSPTASPVRSPCCTTVLPAVSLERGAAFLRPSPWWMALL